MSKKRKCHPGATEINTQAPPPVHRGEVRLEYRSGFGYIWPPAVEPPGRWVVAQPVPCVDCGRVYLQSETAGEAPGAQAVVCYGTRQAVAYLKCRGCLHTFQLPIHRV